MNLWLYCYDKGGRCFTSFMNDGIYPLDFASVQHTSDEEALHHGGVTGSIRGATLAGINRYVAGHTISQRSC